MSKLKYCFLLLFLVLIIKTSYSQIELVPPSNKVYDFLDRMLTNKIIEGYSNSMAPISRREIANFLKDIDNKRKKISKTDKELLDYFLTEFEYDAYKTLNKSSNFFSKKGVGELFSNKKQKYLYSTADSN